VKINLLGNRALSTIGECVELVRRHSPSVFFSVPTLFAQILRSWTEVRQRLPMRLCCSAGEALPAVLFKEWQRLTGLEILDGIGSTEMAYHFISNAPRQEVAGSAGRLVRWRQPECPPGWPRC
jgi:benzoate-CoA ligase